MVEVSIEDGSVPYDLKVKYKSAILMVHPASK
jgi:ribosomal protein S5